MSMFGQQKPLASLSSTLLARKGQAQPAMRRQGHGGFNGMSAGHDDLGWNDMGTDIAPVQAPVPPVLVQREVLREEFAVPEREFAVPEPEFAAPEPEALVETAPEPVVVPEPVAAAIERPAQFKPVSVATAARMEREAARKRGKAAFTLRLDTDRHLRLRIASALHNLSAQTLVTEALDHFLTTLPEVDALIAQIPPRAKR